MKLINYLTPIISIMVLINTLILTFLKDNLNIFLLLIPLLLLTILIFIKGLFFHKKDIYQKNINTYLLIYFFLLILITFIYHRRFTNQFIFHIIPGHIFIKFLNNDPKVSLFTLIYNYLGNFFLLIPFTILLILKNQKYLNFKKMFLTLFTTTIIIELSQGLTTLGEFDIDDIILNILGGIFSLFIIVKYNLLPKIKKLFNTNFHLKKETILLFYLTILFTIIIYNYLIFII